MNFITYKQMPGFLLACFALLFAGSLFAQNPVRGVVTDSAGAPLSGVSVFVKGSSKGTSTNSEGQYNISVPAGSSLTFTSTGYLSQTIPVGEKSVLNIQMMVNMVITDAVVVTALGIKKEKRKLGYATQEVKGEALVKARESQVVSGLTGRVAGITVRNTSTLFETAGLSLRGGSVVIVIDGVVTRGDAWNLNPDDIESINVLKGPAAALLYGSPGLNGAIQVTTKKGKSGANGVEVSLNQSFQTSGGFLNLPKVQTEYGMGWEGYYAFINGKGGGGWYDDYGYVWGPKLNEKDPNTASGFVEVPQYNSPFDPVQFFPFTQRGYNDQSHYKPIPYITRGANNLKNFLNNGLLSTTNISVAGKSDVGEFRISATHLYQKGQVPNTKLNSSTLFMGGGLKLNPKLRMDANISYNRQYTPNYPVTNYGPDNFFYNILLWMGPDVDVRDLRNYWQPGGGRTSGSNFIPYGVANKQQFNYNYTWYNNPWYMAYENLRGYSNDVIVGQASITYTPIKDLDILIRTGGTVNNAFGDLKTPYSYINYTAAPFGQYSVNRSDNVRLVTDVMVTYKKKFLKDFDATIAVGGSNRYEMSRSQNSSTSGGLAIPATYNLSNSRDPVSTSNSISEREVRSVFGYADIAFKRMVYLNVSLRNDWSSTLQKPNHSFFYPSTSLGVIISELMEMPQFISLVKIRGSLADISADFTPYGTIPVYANGIRWNGIPSLNLPGIIYDDAIKPNKTIGREAGLEMRFLKNRIGLDVTYFNYLDKNSIRDVPLSLASGYNTLRVNGDIYTRKGIEVVVNGTAIKKQHFSWDITANYSTVRKRIKEFYGGLQERDGLKIGDRQDTYRGWAWEKSPDGQIVHDATTGRPVYINQQVNLGNYEEDWSFGITNELKYKNLSLSFLFDGRIGGLLYNGVETKMYEGGNHTNTVNHYRDEAYLGQKTYVGQGVVVTSGSVTYDVQGNIISDTRKFAPNTTAMNYIDWVFDTYVNGIDEPVLYKRSFVKLREVILSYTFNNNLLKKTPFKAASISFVGRNLALFTKVPFMDPDGYTGYSLAEPSYRNLGVNLNLKF